ncbi:MAG: hypothetical protein HC828_04450 [Blastochloris sp.]|nr:hypothetical protein [Blastochloris sp.]
MRKMIAAGMAWGAPYVFIYRDVGGVGLLPGEAERLGKITLGTEMGSASQFGAEILAITANGVANVLRHAGILHDRELEAPGAPAQVVAAEQYDDYLMAPVSGIYEPFSEMGAWIEQGQPVGQIHLVEQPFVEPVPVLARTSGMLMSRRAFPLTSQGDCVATLVRPFQLD